MNVHSLMQTNAIVQELVRKTTFQSIKPIPLRMWDWLDEATDWAERGWAQHGQKYRRRVDVEQQTAVFEFEHWDETVAFLLRFG